MATKTLYINESEKYGGFYLATSEELDQMDVEFGAGADWKSDKQIREFDTAYVVEFYERHGYDIDEIVAQAIYSDAMAQYEAGKIEPFASGKWKALYDRHAVEFVAEREQISTELNSVMTPAEIEKEFGLAEGTVRQAVNRAERAGEKWFRRPDERTILIHRKEAEKRWTKPVYGYVANHNNGRTLVLSDGRVFEHRNSGWYLSEEGVEIDAYTTEATAEWDADWTEVDEAEIFERYLDRSREYYIGEPPRN